MNQSVRFSPRSKKAGKNSFLGEIASSGLSVEHASFKHPRKQLTCNLKKSNSDENVS